LALSRRGRGCRGEQTGDQGESRQQHVDTLAINPAHGV
jgi:hypothetical protein